MLGKEEKLRVFRSDAGNLCTYPAMFVRDLPYAYNLLTRVRAGDVTCQYEAYNYARAMKKIDDLTPQESVVQNLLEQAVEETFGLGHAKEAIKQSE